MVVSDPGGNATDILVMFVSYLSRDMAGQGFYVCRHCTVPHFPVDLLASLTASLDNTQINK